MRLAKRTATLLLLLAGIAGIAGTAQSAPARAADAPVPHPFLTDDLTIQIGMFLAKKDAKARADGGIGAGERVIDFESELGNSASEDVVAMELLWRFSPSWSLRAQSFSASSSSATVLQQDISWGDRTISEGSNVEAGTSLEMTRLFFGRSFDTSDRHDYGVGLGLHWLQTAAFIRGELTIVATSSSDVSAAGPLPNIGAWYYYSPNPKFYFGGRLDWFKASIGDYGGGIVNFSIGGNYQLTKHVGIGASYQDFELSADISKQSWNGSIDLAYSGVFVFLSGNW